MLCGDYFFGRTEDYSSCPLIKVVGPVVFSSHCGNDVEVLSSYLKDYKLSLWCNGYLSDTLELRAGVSTITTNCEVRSEDGRTTFTHQNGILVRKGGVVSKLSSSPKNQILRTIEDVLGWPAAGSIIGFGVIFVIGFCYCIHKCIGFKRCFGILMPRSREPEIPPSVRTGVNVRDVQRQMIRLKSMAENSDTSEGLLNPGAARVSIYNINERENRSPYRPALM